MTNNRSTTPTVKGTEAKHKRPNKVATYVALLLKWLTPQPRKFRQALFYTGPSKDTWLMNKYKKYASVFHWTERILFLFYTLFCIWENNLRLWLLIFLFYILLSLKNDYKFIVWYLKIFLFQRRFYAHRRTLYKQGTLRYHFFKTNNHNKANRTPIKLPKKFNRGKVIVWGQSVTIQVAKYKALPKNRITKKQTPGEYIM